MGRFVNHCSLTGPSACVLQLNAWLRRQTAVDLEVDLVSLVCKRCSELLRRQLKPKHVLYLQGDVQSMQLLQQRPASWGDRCLVHAELLQLYTHPEWLHGRALHNSHYYYRDGLWLLCACVLHRLLDGDSLLFHVLLLP
jgi:hypothetical protein